MTEEKICNCKTIDTEFGKLHEIDFTNYKFLTNYCPVTEKNQTIEKTEFIAKICLRCGHLVINMNGKLVHLAVFGNKDDQIAISEVCHNFENGSENSYYTWGKRCKCDKPTIELHSKDIAMKLVIK